LLNDVKSSSGSSMHEQIGLLDAVTFECRTIDRRIEKKK
jgi:hypothetical protein